MKEQFTKGPWYESSTGNHQGLVISEVTGANIAVTYNEKDARLIAAAPEMFEALQFIQTALADWRDGKESTNHPEHGRLNLEEVKYLVVDTILDRVRGIDET